MGLLQLAAISLVQLVVALLELAPPLRQVVELTSFPMIVVRLVYLEVVGP